MAGRFFNEVPRLLAPGATAIPVTHIASQNNNHLVHHECMLPDRIPGSQYVVCVVIPLIFSFL
ncbi:hypothetical protein BDR05DRAFT_954601 [Suillus weaverae]|nr:hypothetical protein BDR05DRAFT_954601 [Suillus weaverae]